MSEVSEIQSRPRRSGARFDRAHHNRIAMNLAARRKKAGLTQLELARRAGVSTNSIFRWERLREDPLSDQNARTPKSAHLAALARALRCKADDLLAEPSLDIEKPHRSRRA